MKKHFFAGFDIGGTKIKYGLIDVYGKINFKDSLPSPATITGLMSALKDAWLQLKSQPGGQVVSCGFGFAGFFSLREQKILQSPNYPSLDGFPLKTSLEKFIDVPFTIDNDANMAAFGEFSHGAGQGAHSLVLLTVGTGIGSGIILEGQLWHGKCGFAGELGHITVNPEGERCNCGSRGCLETEASAPKIVKNFQILTGKKYSLTAKDVYILAKKGDRKAIESFARCGYYLGIGLGIIINFLNPQKIIIGGGVTSAGKYLLDPARKEARLRSHPVSYACCQIVRAELGNDAGLIGSAAWSRRRTRTQL